MSRRTCSGVCCSVFLIGGGMTLEEIEEENIKDCEFVLDMLVLLSPEQAIERSERFGNSISLDDVHKYPYYYCRHWNEETRLCTRYKERPSLCRDYPYEHECTCTSSCDYRAPLKTQAKWRAIRKRQAKQEPLDK